MFEDTTTIGKDNVAVMTRGEFLEQIMKSSDSEHISDGFEIACQFIGGSSYLLARDDSSDEFVVSSNWPYDLAKSLGKYIVTDRVEAGELSQPYSAFDPSFIDVDARFKIPNGFSRQVCILPITCGEQKFILLFLFRLNSSYGQERIRDAALACSYHISEYVLAKETETSQADLTEREMECLAWIAKGKTSDEIALIIGISRNTVNNYITSIMNKTATKSRAEAVAEAVRGQLI